MSTRIAARAVQERLERSAIESPRDRRKDVTRPDGPPGWHLLWRSLTASDVLTFFTDAERDFPDIAHLRLASEHTYILNSPEAIVDLFLTHGRMTMKGRGLQGAKALLGNGLLTSEGDFHLRQRRLVQPAFHRDRIASYVDAMASITERHNARRTPGQAIDLAADFSSLTLEIVGRTLFGADLRGDAAEVGAALEEVLTGLGSRLLFGTGVMRIPTPGRRRALLAGARLDAIVQRMIDEHRASGPGDDMLSMLIEATEDGRGMDDQQLRDEAMTLVLAGHETTAMALTWATWLLARHPSELAWLREELDSVLAGGVPRFDDLAHLPRTRAVVAEAMRLYPPAWLMGRRTLADVTVGGYLIPTGAIVVASPWALHRSPRWWDSALTFRPQRWLTTDGDFDESAPGQPRGAWFAFGWGNRRCIGEGFAWAEAQTVLAVIAQSWDFRLLPGPVTPRPAVTLRPATPIRAVAEPR
jgi:cytochrome P450